MATRVKTMSLGEKAAATVDELERALASVNPVTHAQGSPDWRSGPMYVLSPEKQLAQLKALQRSGDLKDYVPQGSLEELHSALRGRNAFSRLAGHPQHRSLVTPEGAGQIHMPEEGYVEYLKKTKQISPGTPEVSPEGERAVNAILGNHELHERAMPIGRNKDTFTHADPRVLFHQSNAQAGFTGPGRGEMQEFIRADMKEAPFTDWFMKKHYPELGFRFGETKMPKAVQARAAERWPTEEQLPGQMKQFRRAQRGQWQDMLHEAGLPREAVKQVAARPDRALSFATPQVRAGLSTENLGHAAVQDLIERGVLNPGGRAPRGAVGILKKTLRRG